MAGWKKWGLAGGVLALLLVLAIAMVRSTHQGEMVRLPPEVDQGWQKMLARIGENSQSTAMRYYWQGPPLVADVEVGPDFLQNVWVPLLESWQPAPETVMMLMVDRSLAGAVGLSPEKMLGQMAGHWSRDTAIAIIAQFVTLDEGKITEQSPWLPLQSIKREDDLSKPDVSFVPVSFRNIN